MVEREPDITTRHCQALHGIETGGIFGPRTAQELAPRWHLLEQSLDPDAGAGRKRSRPLAHRLAVIDFDSPAVASAHPAFEDESRDAGDGRQGLPAEAEAG